MGLYSNFKTMYNRFVQPLRPDLLTPVFTGIVLCYFGGGFSLIIAATEAYRLCGWNESKDSLVDLGKDLDNVLVASEKDDLLDLNNDGIPDVQQISSEEFLKRKAEIVLQNVDYHRVTNSLNGLHAGFMAAVATLKVKYCKALTLGSSVGDQIVPLLLKTLVPLLKLVVPKTYHNWIPVTVTSAAKFLMVRLALTQHRLISAYHSAMRGGLMFSRGLLRYFSAMKLVHINEDDTYMDELVGYALAYSGLWFQIKYGLSLPFPLNMFLFPFTLLEQYLIANVAGDVKMF